MLGEIKKIIEDNKYGFIRCGDGKEYYFNADSLVGDISFGDLATGMEIEFDIVKGENRKLRAVNCKIIENENVKFFKESVLDLHTNKEQYDIFCDKAREYAERLKTGKVTTSMIRKVYARVLNASTVTDIKLLRPHFAYISGRNEKNYVLREFMDLLDYLAKELEMDNMQQLENYKQFLEAIVAYRKYVGKDK